MLVSNAYTVDVTAAHEMSVASWERQLSVNLTGAFLGFRAVLPDLREQRGAVVLTSSVHAHKGIPGHPAYAASKGALLSLCGQLAVEYGPEVRVNAVLPGPILTAAWDRVSEEDRDKSVIETAAQRFGTPRRPRRPLRSWPPTRRPTSPDRACSWTAAGPSSRPRPDRRRTHRTAERHTQR